MLTLAAIGQFQGERLQFTCQSGAARAWTARGAAELPLGRAGGFCLAPGTK
jgi:hypothetical protein